MTCQSVYPFCSGSTASNKTNELLNAIISSNGIHVGSRKISTTGVVQAPNLILTDVCSGSSNSMTLTSNNGVNQLLLGTNAGTYRQVLTSGGPDGPLYWSSGGGAGGGVQPLNVILEEGSFASTGQTMNLSGT